MSEDTMTLATVYKGWDIYQERLIEAIKPLSMRQLALQAAPHLRSVGMIAGHIIATRVWWFHHIMGEGSVELAELERWDDEGMPPLDAAELVRGLRESWYMIEDALAHLTPSSLQRTYTRRGETFTCQWIIWHVIEHDLHHAGELSYVLGMHNVPAIEL